MSKTAEQLRGDAAAHRQEARESFERCDTDGFLSQWASGKSAQLADTRAEIAEAGGMAWFARWELHRDGRRIVTRKVETRYGTKWRIDETDEWISYGSARAAKRKGYEMREVIEQAAAFAVMAGSGTGLSGQAWVAVYREGAKAAQGWRCVGIADCESYKAWVAEAGMGL
jgi:hypothetical protein